MTTPDHITELKPNEVFVFGSNLKGIHGAGAAKTALAFGARHGVGVGHWGQTYAIATKGLTIKTLPLDVIEDQVKSFLCYAKAFPWLRFLVTRIGCGLAGYEPKDIAPFFKGHTANVILPADFLPWTSSSSASSSPPASLS